MSNVNVLKSNHDIILREANQKGFNYTGDNLFTFVQWRKRGYIVVRGQKAFIKLRLWTYGDNKRLLPAQLFTREQVTKLDCGYGCGIMSVSA